MPPGSTPGGDANRNKTVPYKTTSVPRDFRIGGDFFQHPKTQRLRQALGADGVLALVEIWNRACLFYWKGVIDSTANDLESAIGWNGGELIATLVDIGFLDVTPDGFHIHNWEIRQIHIFGFEEFCRKQSERRRTA